MSNENQGFEGNGSKQSSCSAGERDGDLPVMEDIASEESSDNTGGNDDVDLVSDCESSVNGTPVVDHTKIGSNERKRVHESSSAECPIVNPINLHPKVGVDALVRLDESDKVHKIIKERFILGLEAVGVNAQVVHIDKNLFDSSEMVRAGVYAFVAYTKAVENLNEGHANIRHAWFGASKDEINNIIMHGFNHDNVEKNGAFGCGLYLNSDQAPIESAKSTTVDNEGTRHILLCRVLLGKMETIKPGSTQCYPSSEEFQTGVDNLLFPKKYIIWSTQLNSHVLPEYLITFKTLPGINGPQIGRIQLEVPFTPRIQVEDLISEVSKILPPDATKKLDEYYRSFMENKISWRDMLQGFVGSAGQRLLLMTVKDFIEQRAVKRLRTVESKGNQPSVT